MMNIRRFLALGLLLATTAVHAQFGISNSGSITTQNLVPTGAATASSCVALDITNKGTFAVQASGTYTGALSAQRTTNGSVWETLSDTNTFKNAAGTATATIGSGTTGTFVLSGVAGFRAARICGLSAMTGEADVVIYSSIPGGGGGGGGTSDATAANQTTMISSLSVMDDWDETDRAKVNIIVGQAGVAAGAGVVTANTPRVEIASDSALIAAINATYSVATATLSNVASSATNVTCLASNASRKAATIYNDSASASLMVKKGATASATSFTYLLLPGGTLTLPTYPVYTGILDCIWTAAVGSARVTEE